MTHPTSKSSGDLGVSAATVVDGQAIITGVGIKAVAADVLVIIYDNNAASGTKVFEYEFDFSVEGLSRYVRLPNVKCTKGMHVVVTGAGAVVIVHYR